MFELVTTQDLIHEEIEQGSVLVYTSRKERLLGMSQKDIDSVYFTNVELTKEDFSIDPPNNFFKITLRLINKKMYVANPYIVANIAPLVCILRVNKEKCNAFTKLKDEAREMICTLFLDNYIILPCYVRKDNTFGIYGIQNYVHFWFYRNHNSGSFILTDFIPVDIWICGKPHTYAFTSDIMHNDFFGHLLSKSNICVLLGSNTAKAMHRLDMDTVFDGSIA